MRASVLRRDVGIAMWMDSMVKCSRESGLCMRRCVYGTPIAHGGYLERNGALDQSIGLVGELGNIIERLAILWLWM